MGIITYQSAIDHLIAIVKPLGGEIDVRAVRKHAVAGMERAVPVFLAFAIQEVVRNAEECFPDARTRPTLVYYLKLALDHLYTPPPPAA